MKICAAQTRSIKGDIQQNINNHKRLIGLAVDKKADMIVFPELSLMGYEPTLAKDLVSTQDDTRLDDFQTLSDAHQIIIGVGLPTKSETGICISLILFQPHQARQTYSKQHLHADELPYFIEGQTQVYVTVKQSKMAPAICYESLLPEHAENAFKNGATLYMASVAKSQKGIDKAFKHYPEIAIKYGMTVVMANCVGFCDNFNSVGNSAIWNNKGILVGQLDGMSEGLILFDTEMGSGNVNSFISY